MNRYNIALLPAEASLQVLLSGLAQSLFANLQDGYLLGPQALAHVTLCQFRADSDAAAQEAFRFFATQGALELSILPSLQVEAGRGNHVGKFWAFLPIQANDALRALQKSCALHVQAVGLENLTPVDGYKPHVTLARLGAALPPPRHEIFAARAGKPTCFLPALGLSSETGVFVKKIA